MHRSVRAILLLLGCWLLSSPSHAGQTSNQPNVAISLSGSGSFFYGSIGVARNGADNVQYIGCLVYATTSGKSVYCGARDASGTVAACSSNNAQYVEAVATMNENSILDVGFDQGAAVCTHVGVDNSSASLPVSP